MKQLFYLLLLTSLTSLAQNKFIEVEVRDTITLYPKSFEYNILIGESYKDDEWGENYTFDQKAYDERIKKNKDKIEKLLQSKKYNYKPSTSNTLYPPLGAPNLTGFSVTLTNQEELKSLLQRLEKFEFVNGSIDTVNYKDEERAEGLLLKKLIDKAKSKAAVIAAYSDLKLGKIIEVREGKEMDDLAFNIHDIYVRGASKSFSEDSLTGSLSKSIVIKFAAE